MPEWFQDLCSTVKKQQKDCCSIEAKFLASFVKYSITILHIEFLKKQKGIKTSGAFGAAKPGAKN